MKRVLKWGSNLVTVILGVVLIFTAYASVTSKMNNGTPKIFGYQMYEVLSGSMEPGIHTGSVIFDKPGVNENNLKVGDVITFNAPKGAYGNDQNIIVTHRIQQIEHQNGQLMFQTKGDANNSPDPELVSARNVIAQYGNITIPYAGYYLNFTKSKTGILVSMIVPGAFLILVTMISLLRDISKLDKNKTTDSVDMTTNIMPDSTTESVTKA